MRLRLLLFSSATTTAALMGALVLGSACDSRPVVPIEDEPDVRADVVPAAPEASVTDDGGDTTDATDDRPDTTDGGVEADGFDAESDAEAG